ncbi:hypothetical protein B0H12DRAFT_1240041 [Mycena haematopus]|nr:hypothetical protein B0H12DRAFT_1240041 [Mycena haematopus]
MSSTTHTSTHTCTCALEEFSHEVPSEQWRAHQAELQAFLSGTCSPENKTSLEALALDVDRAIWKLQDPSLQGPDHPQGTVDQTREVISVVAVSLQDHEDSPQKDFIVNQLRNLEQELDKFTFAEYGTRWPEMSRLTYDPPAPPLDKMASNASRSHFPGAFNQSDASMEIEPTGDLSLAQPLDSSFVHSPGLSTTSSQSIRTKALPALPNNGQMAAYDASTMPETQPQMPVYNANTMLQTQQQPQWTPQQMATYNANAMARMQPMQGVQMPAYDAMAQAQQYYWPQQYQYYWPQGQQQSQYWTQMGNYHQQTTGSGSSQARGPSAPQIGNSQQFILSQEGVPSAQTLPPGQGPSSHSSEDRRGKRRHVELQAPEGQGVSVPLTRRDQNKEIRYQKERVDFAYDKSKEAIRANKELQNRLHDTTQALNGMAQTTHVVQEVLVQSHQDDIAQLNREHEKALKAQKAKFEKDLQDAKAALNAEHEKKLSREQGQNEGRVAAVVARQGRPAPTASSSRYAPYTTAEARVARDSALLQNAKRALTNDPNIVLTPRELLVDPDSDGDETMDEAEQAQAALQWVLDQMEKEKRKKKSKSEAPPARRNKLQAARQEEQQHLTRDEDKFYKSIVRAVFGKATGLYNAKAYKDYQPTKKNTVERCAHGKVRPPTDKTQFYFGEDYMQCLWNRILLDRLVKRTVALKATDPTCSHLPDVSEDYLRALHLNVLKGAYEQWRLNQTRDNETAADAQARANEAEEERRLQTTTNSRKARKNKLRVQCAKKMRNIRLNVGDAQGARLFEKAMEVAQALGTKAWAKKKATVLVIRRQYWRAAIATKYMRMVDFYIKRGKKKGIEESAAPPKLARNMYDDEWIKTQKTRDNEFEETLEIRKNTFQMVEFDFNGFSSEEDWEPGEDDADDADVEDDEDEDENENNAEEEEEEVEDEVMGN